MNPFFQLGLQYFSRFFFCFFSFVYKSASTYSHNGLIQISKEISCADLETKPIVQIL